ncbi:embryogenesis-associated protein EMB8 [Argentina anserina]|uniref:embryogenesis-associated protein EMB8 n=1 Tax=Argentina anserina TaxID=57926 RepID=UPI0021765509|nr:embryogenesis-associated protein EMB8 [Potentilla anserina]
MANYVFEDGYSPYNPFPLFLWNHLVETILAAFYRDTPNINLRRECLRTKDNGSVSLDWVPVDDRLLPADAPLLILLLCVTEGSEDSYVMHMLIRARDRGWRVVVFNRCGCGASPATTPQFYSTSFLGDIREDGEVVDHVVGRYLEAYLYVVGWSLGANILVHYLGHEFNACHLSGVVSLCNPFNLVIADEDFHKGFNNIYDKFLSSIL